MGFAISASRPLLAAKAGGADQTNFPALLRIVDPRLRSIANGGQVQSATGLDIVPCSDNPCTLANKLAFRRVLYLENDGAGNGVFIAFIKIASYSHTSDTTVNVGIGDASIVSDQQSVTGTWSTIFTRVLLHEGGASVDLTDDTGATTLTNSGASPLTVALDKYNPTGQGGAVQGTGTGYGESTANLVTAVPVAIASFFNTSSLESSTLAALCNTANATVNGFQLEVQAGGTLRIRTSTNTTSSAASYSANTWNLASAIWVNATTRRVKLNLNAATNGDGTSVTPSGIDRFTEGARKSNSAAGNIISSNMKIGATFLFNADPTDSFLDALYNQLADNDNAWGAWTGLNAPPSVALGGATPADAAQIDTGTTITLDCSTHSDAEDGNLTGSSLKYYYTRVPGGAQTLIGSPTAGQTAITWAIPDGHYDVVCKATDSNGAVTTSTSRRFHVNRYTTAGTYVNATPIFLPVAQTSFPWGYFDPWEWPRAGAAPVDSNGKTIAARFFECGVLEGDAIILDSGGHTCTNGVASTSGGPFSVSATNKNGVTLDQTNVMADAVAASQTWVEPVITYMRGNRNQNAPSDHPITYSDSDLWDMMHAEVRLAVVAAYQALRPNVVKIERDGHSAGAAAAMRDAYQFTRRGVNPFSCYIATQTAITVNQHAPKAAGYSFTNAYGTLTYWGMDSGAIATLKDIADEFKRVVLDAGIAFQFWFGNNDALNVVQSALATESVGATGAMTYTSPAPADTTGFFDRLHELGVAIVLNHQGFTGTVATPNFSSQTYTPSDKVACVRWEGYSHNNTTVYHGVASGKSGADIYWFDIGNTQVRLWANAQPLVTGAVVSATGDSRRRRRFDLQRRLQAA